jgi:hypothetical protein
MGRAETEKESNGMAADKYDPKAEALAALASLRSAAAMLTALDVPLEVVQGFVLAVHAEQRATQLQHWPTDAEPTVGDEAVRVLRSLGLPLPASPIVPQRSALSREWSLWAEEFRSSRRLEEA